MPGAPAGYYDRGSDDSEDEMVRQLEQVTSQHNKLAGLPKVKRPRSVKQQDADARKKKWKAARLRFCTQAMDQMFERDCLSKELFTTEESKIEFCDSPMAAEFCIERVLKALNSTLTDPVHFGFDTEGDLDTIQLYFKIDERKFHIIFHLQPLYTRSHFIPLSANFSHNFGPKKLKFGYVPRAN